MSHTGLIFHLPHMLVLKADLLAGFFDPFEVSIELAGHDEAFGVIGVGFDSEFIEMVVDFV
jgi:hypothetical protein